MAAPLRGISVAGLRALVAEAGGRAALAGWTTDRLKADFVIGATRPGAAYADVLAARPGGAALVADADVFLSHAYGYAFLDLVDAVTAWEDARRASGGPGVSFFYVDLAVVCQHPSNVIVPFAELRDKFAAGVRGTARALFLLDFAAPLSLSRAWCVFELATAVEAHGARLEVIMPPRDEGAFREALVGDFGSLVYKTCTVDTERAAAFLEEDRANIFRMIREEMGGFARVNQLVIGAMREWMAAAGRAALDALPAGERASSALAGNFAKLLRDQGKLDEAAPLCREALAGRRRALGDSHVDTLSAITDYASLLWSQGKLDEAAPLFREALEGMRRTRGDEHPHTLTAVSNFANVMRTQGRLDEAASLFHEAIEVQRRTLGDAHASTLRAVGNLAAVLFDQGKFDEALPFSREALEGRRRALGDAHPETLASLMGFAELLRKLGRLDEAAPACREALDGCRRTLGDAHVYSLMAASNHAELLQSQGKLDEAAPLFCEVVAGFRRTLGDAHSHTLESISAYAGCLSGQGRLAEAEPLHREAFDGRRRVLGDSHPDTVKSTADVAAVLKAQGRLGEAAALLRDALSRGPQPTLQLALAHLLSADAAEIAAPVAAQTPAA